MFLSALLHQFEFECTTKGIPNIDDCHVGVTRMPMPFASKIKCRSWVSFFFKYSSKKDTEIYYSLQLLFKSLGWTVGVVVLQLKKV